MEPHGLKPLGPGLPRLVRYGEILSDNFATLVGVIRRHVTSAESAVAPRLFAAFIHGLKSRGILRRRINLTVTEQRNGSAFAKASAGFLRSFNEGEHLNLNPYLIPANHRHIAAQLNGSLPCRRPP